MKHIKVLHLLASSEFSGAENVACQIIEMCKADSNVEMAYCSLKGGISKVIAERNVLYFPLNHFTPFELRQIIRIFHPDVIHAHDVRACFIASFFANNIRLVVHIHGNSLGNHRFPLKSLLLLLSARKANHIFWVSESCYNDFIFRRFFRDRSEILYNILDMDKLYQKMNEDLGEYHYDIIYVGRLTYPKNPERLIRILSIIAKIRPNIKMAIVGTGDMEDITKIVARKLNVYHNIEFCGFHPNPYKRIHDAKLLLMTSRWEGTPMCALEALALGTPIVSTSTDGLCELVSDGITGYLVDDDNLLAEKCMSILDNEYLRAKMSNQSIQKAKDIMNIEKYKDHIYAAYDR